MQFAQPIWLLAGLAACTALVWQFRRFDQRQRVALTQFASARLLPKLASSISTSRKLAKRVLFTLGIACVFIALARPQAGFEFQETHRKGLELLFAVDTSKSMLAQDVKPDRLTRAKLAVTDLVTKLNGDGVGLIAFAGSSFLQCPVTLDYDAFRESLDALDVNVIPRGGTDIASAIHEAEAVFRTRTTADKILILITDGEDLGGEAIAAAQSAAKNGVKIFTVGVGSTTGELVPVPSENGGTDFAKDENGKPVKSHLDETTLKKIAEVTGGMYQPLGAQGEGLTNIYDRGLNAFTRQDLKTHEARIPLEKFYWALLAALVCFIGELLIGNRRRTAVPQLRTATTAAALLLFAGLASTQASPQSAERAYQKGDFAKSQQDYAATVAKEPAKAELQFNSGSAAYKAGDYGQAASGFEKSLKTEQVPLQQKAYYNLGNTRYRLGQKTEKENPQETIKTWDQAVKSYDAALQIKAGDADAKHNRDFVQRKIEQLKKQQEQKKQNQQKQQDQKNQQQKSQQQNNQQQQQNKNQKNNDQQDQSQNQQNDSKDQKGDNKNQPQNSKDQKGNSGEQKNESKDSKEGDKEKKSDESKDQNSEGKKDEKDQQQRDQQGSGQEKKDAAKDQRADSAKPKAGNDKKDQQPQQADAKSGQGQQQQKPADPAKKADDVQAANGEKAEDAQDGTTTEERREPNELTKEEAKQLLDALKNDERKAPAISQQGRGAQQPEDQKILKDW
jgi:Ca-activated chloride channel family protein